MLRKLLGIEIGWIDSISKQLVLNSVYYYKEEKCFKEGET